MPNDNFRKVGQLINAEDVTQRAFNEIYKETETVRGDEPDEEAISPLPKKRISGEVEPVQRQGTKNLQK